ncbi:hypothetical protein B1812_10625 [Methylocystis bryophila]|uniref:Uncharacterized protein n=1 Tax=Methylocystis bryophila TaxID=655015 RepID=A0A1W6MV24_9HYPH|nr:hypothetical protein B1812_10625 [Methylocystis bryophila]
MSDPIEPASGQTSRAALSRRLKPSGIGYDCGEEDHRESQRLHRQNVPTQDAERRREPLATLSCNSRFATASQLQKVQSV